MSVYMYACVYTHTMHICICTNTAFRHLTTNRFSLHRVPSASKWKMPRKQSKWQTTFLCHLVIHYAASSFLKWQSFSFPLFSGAHHYSGSNGPDTHKKAIQPDMISTLLLRTEDVQMLPSSACTLTCRAWTTNKENSKSKGNPKAVNLSGTTEQ